VPTRRRSLKAPRAAESAATTGEPPRSAVVATGLQLEATVAAVATTAATAAAVVPPGRVPTTVDQAAVVEIPDDDAPLPGWG
jgi:hypothetical protein